MKASDLVTTERLPATNWKLEKRGGRGSEGVQSWSHWTYAGFYVCSVLVHRAGGAFWLLLIERHNRRPDDLEVRRALLPFGMSDAFELEQRGPARQFLRPVDYHGSVFNIGAAGGRPVNGSAGGA